jgi:rhombotail lipoprotein
MTSFLGEWNPFGKIPQQEGATFAPGHHGCGRQKRAGIVWRYPKYRFPAQTKYLVFFQTTCGSIPPSCKSSEGDQMTMLRYLLVGVVVAALAGCASMFGARSVRHEGSLVGYLYPDAAEAPAMQPTVTQLRPPVRVGIGFVPGRGRDSLAEIEKTRLLERVRDSFRQYSYIGEIEIIPSSYMAPRGGWNNLDQVARMFNVEVVALLSYDQISFNDTNGLAVLYWTIVGAYVVKGDRYDVQTLVDAAVFDVRSRKLLFRAPGTSQVKGSSTMARYSEESRNAQANGFRLAVDELIPQLQTELASFKERIRNDPHYRVVNKDGYRGGGSLGWVAAVLAIVALVFGHARRRPAA